MCDDERALLAAIIADPADDVARLVYADCLEENGNPARAEFIRVQIEAERHHVHSAHRAMLNDRAVALFAEHWIDWWGEVCKATGLPLPVRGPTSRLGRLASRVGLRGKVVNPYQLGPFRIDPHSDQPYDVRLAGWFGTRFSRGFAESLEISHPNANASIDPWFLSLWPTVAPLTRLTLVAPRPNALPDGPHLGGVHSLTLSEYDPRVLLDALASPHLQRLEDLTLQIREDEDIQVREGFADELARAILLPRVRQLKRLSLPIWTDRTAEIVAATQNLAGLEALGLFLLPGRSGDAAANSHRLATLARSPNLAGLRELTVRGNLDADGIEALIRNPVWVGLRRLGLEMPFNQAQEAIHPLGGSDDLSELEKIWLLGDYAIMDGAGLAVLVRSPLLKRLRHYAHLCDFVPGVDGTGLLDVVNPDRIETYAVKGGKLPPRLEAALRKKFGDRLHVFT